MRFNRESLSKRLFISLSILPLILKLAHLLIVATTISHCVPVKIYVINSSSIDEDAQAASSTRLALLRSLVLSERSSRVSRSIESNPQQQQQPQTAKNAPQAPPKHQQASSLSNSWIELDADRVKPSWLNVSSQYKLVGDTVEKLSQYFAPEQLVKPAFDTPIILKTNLGLLEGVRSTKFGKHLYTFLSVPYGEPPIDKLRFKAPLPVERWTGILQATKWPPFCVQPSMSIESRISPVHIITEMMNEDCLYLNVWTPSLKSNRASKPANKRRPVMAFIHGGAFQFGGISVDENDGSELALLGDVVVVSFNYRLGVFGFLNANNPKNAPNNVGLLDQRLALEWIQANIHSFGGDPTQVTLFGESAGGHSVGLHLISPKSFPLFKRAIFQSGVPLSFLRSYDMNSDVEGAPTSEAISSIMLAKRLKCYFESQPAPSEDGSLNSTASEESAGNEESSDSNGSSDDNATDDEPILSDATVECLTNYSSLDILRGTGPPRSSGFMPTGNDKKGFFPLGSIKESFDPDNLNIGPQKDFLIGTNTDEGSFMLHFGLPALFPANGDPRVSSIEELKEMIKKEIVKSIASHAASKQQRNNTAASSNTEHNNNNNNDTSVNNKTGSGTRANEDGKFNPQAHLFRPLLRLSNSLMEQFISRNASGNEYAKMSKEAKFGNSISTLVTDILFLCPAKSLAKVLADANRNVYYYVYNHRSSQTVYANWMGVTHHDEVEFVFGRPLRMADTFSGSDVEMSQRMIRSWAHFARTGKMPDQFGVKWPAYRQDDDFYMNLEDGKASVRTKLHDRFCNIYDNVIAIHLQARA